MKPLLKSAPLTYEDLLIWARILKRTVDPGGEGSVLDAWESADRRDAALMLLITRTGRMSVPHPNGRAVAHSLMSFGIGMGDM